MHWIGLDVAVGAKNKHLSGNLFAQALLQTLQTLYTEYTA